MRGDIHELDRLTLKNLKEMLGNHDDGFLSALKQSTNSAEIFNTSLQLHKMRLRSLQLKATAPSETTVKIAVIGGYTLNPLADLIEHFVAVFCGVNVALWLGAFDNYVAEILDDSSDLYSFDPDYIIFLPSHQRSLYSGNLNASLDEQVVEAEKVVDEILGFAHAIHEKTSAQIITLDFPLTSFFDPGQIRSTSLISDYSFRKYVNLHLGLRAPSYMSLCSVEFLANRIGTTNSYDLKAWFETKQPYSADLIALVAKEIGKVIQGLRTAAKKVIVLDLDNTLWGGVIGDDGLEGIEIGTTNSRGEAFRFFQQYLLNLSKRGFLLAVCSKNDHENAIEPFLKHPEMVIRLSDIVSFKANWNPKADNIREMAVELALGLDSFVFLDDNPAEIEIVRQFVPEVTGICLGADPSEFVPMVANARLFESAQITAEDLERVKQYKQEAKRQELKSTVTDMGAYLASLEMVAETSSFTPVDVPRITQLINKSNQFNLTTRRRSESEVELLMADPAARTLTIRLSDRFGAHGLICIVIGRIEENTFAIDTWLMSCRVLKRQVEEVTLNLIAELAQAAHCTTIKGEYIPTAKNGMVKNLFADLGFSLTDSTDDSQRYILELVNFSPRETKITIG